MQDYVFLKLRENPVLSERAAQWFSKMWGIPEEAYSSSMAECNDGNTVPQWYVALHAGQIVAGMGVIENDFHPRRDLTPNICAVYVDEAHRGRSLAGKLLKFVCDDMSTLGVDTLYLLADHIGFYEKYGWKFLCMVTADGEETPSRMYIHQN